MFLKMETLVKKLFFKHKLSKTIQSQYCYISGQSNLLPFASASKNIDDDYTLLNLYKIHSGDD